ncbi:MAG: hypothetical protein JW864_10610 [Spirochaetes bacterium]|nr:hypothetical protein [Spirochaetota bacterium]
MIKAGFLICEQMKVTVKPEISYKDRKNKHFCIGYAYAPGTSNERNAAFPVTPFSLLYMQSGGIVK